MPLTSALTGGAEHAARLAVAARQLLAKLGKSAPDLLLPRMGHAAVAAMQAVSDPLPTAAVGKEGRGAGGKGGVAGRGKGQGAVPEPQMGGMGMLPDGAHLHSPSAQVSAFHAPCVLILTNGGQLRTQP